MPKSRGQKAASESSESNYDRISLRVTKGRKDELQVHAFSKGESLNAFINRAIDNQLLRDDW